MQCHGLLPRRDLPAAVNVEDANLAQLRPGSLPRRVDGILILAAVVFFVLKAIGVDTDLDLVAVGLACFAGSFLL